MNQPAIPNEFIRCAKTAAAIDGDGGSQPPLTDMLSGPRLMSVDARSSRIANEAEESTGCGRMAA